MECAAVNELYLSALYYLPITSFDPIRPFFFPCPFKNIHQLPFLIDDGKASGHVSISFERKKKKKNRTEESFESRELS